MKSRTLIIAKNDLRQLQRSRDFWIPMLFMAGLFFVLIPTFLLLVISRIGDIHVVQQISSTLQVLPPAARHAIEARCTTPTSCTSYALAVYLFAPLAIVVPLTISSAVGANAVVGERERGSGEFLAHSPASEREIYMGKLIASLLPGYFTTLAGFGVYAIIVNLIVGPQVGGWFFPTGEWWVLMFWIVPPFIAMALSLVLRVSARVKSAAAAQQSSGLITLPLILLAYGQSTGTLFGAKSAGWIVGGVAWLAALYGLARASHALARERLLGVDTEP
ncbi:MAG: ABC transporter permease subunit [Actinomycetota bacterium]|nr:ABC transporter permease subunit [Actinomycetota bacterium]